MSHPQEKGQHHEPGLEVADFDGPPPPSYEQVQQQQQSRDFQQSRNPYQQHMQYQQQPQQGQYQQNPYQQPPSQSPYQQLPQGQYQQAPQGQYQQPPLKQEYSHPLPQHQHQELQGSFQDQYYAGPAGNQPPSNLEGLDDASKRALATFGSPYAHNANWAATPSDATLMALPKQAFMMRVKARFARTAGDIFNPPAPSFQRQPTPQWTYQPFPPISIKSAGKLLSDGFKPLYPGRVLADHDVSAADWARFLEDIQVAGRLTGAQSVWSNVAPVTMHLGATGYFVTKAIEKGMKKKKVPIIAEAVETWMQNFFGARRLDVYIVDGKERITARRPGEPVPTMTMNTPKPAFDSSSSDSSDSSEDERMHHSHSGGGFGGTSAEQMGGKQARRQERRDRKAMRREEKRDRRDERREQKRDRRDERRANKAERKDQRRERRENQAMIVIAPL